VTPDDPLVAHHLATSSVMRLATTSARGTTTLTPIWFVLHRGCLVSGTAASTMAARNIAADPRVTVLLDGEGAGRSAYLLRLRGTAEVNTGIPPAGALARLAAKYYLSPGGLRSEVAHRRMWGLRVRYYAQAEGVWLAIHPGAAELVPVPAGPVSPPGAGR
jgi:hypothetical protein